MIKKQYIEELNINRLLKRGVRDSNIPEGVTRVQEWLNLWRYMDPEWVHRVEVDGQYGPQTEKVVNAFQQTYSLGVDGKVGDKTFSALTAPILKAFSRLKNTDLRQLIIGYAEQHLANMPRELYNSNRGPWVRAYMDGNEGKPWAWCMGFVQTILDQAFTTQGNSFISIMPKTYSCDVVGEHGKTTGRLIRNVNLREDPSQIVAGDVFLVVKKPWDWTHTGIITGVDDEFIHTIEGNTNDEGSREGFEVCRRYRNFKAHNIDVFKVDE